MDTFFFQAEDGIRVGRVTGVQTCALPISTANRRAPTLARVESAGTADRPPQRSRVGQVCGAFAGPTRVEDRQALRYRSRSEERRVGKECKFRWVSYA